MTAAASLPEPATTDTPQLVYENVPTDAGPKTFTLLFPDLMRPLTPEERDGLEKDIAEVGILDPIAVDEHFGVIDGGNRIDIAVRAGNMKVPFITYPAGMSLDEKRHIAVSLNKHRRHTSQEERRHHIITVLKGNPNRRDLDVAKEVGCSDKTVTRIRRDLERREEIPSVTRSTDSLGRDMPVRKPETAKPTPKPTPQPKPPVESQEEIAARLADVRKFRTSANLAGSYATDDEADEADEPDESPQPTRATVPLRPGTPKYDDAAITEWCRKLTLALHARNEALGKPASFRLVEARWEAFLEVWQRWASEEPE